MKALICYYSTYGNVYKAITGLSAFV